MSEPLKKIRETSHTAELFDVCDWHSREFAGQPDKRYMFYDGHKTCCFTFQGDEQELKAVNRFLTVYRRIRRWWG